MLSVSETAELLGVSGARVRAMLASGKLSGEKVGNTWAVSASSVRRRLRENPGAGRPSHKQRAFSRECPDAQEAHALYDEAERILSGCYNAEFLGQARSEREQAFWVLVSDFFLQQKQIELIEQGVY